MADQTAVSYLDEALRGFRGYKRLAEGAFTQLQERDFFYAPDQESNSIATIVKHMSGNMRSRWTDFLSSDGEKPDRNRDTEFETPPETRAALLALWEAGWKICLGALEPLSDADLGRTITIRGEPHSVMQAINRQIAHYAHHIGQIVFLAKHLTAKATGKWESLSVPRGQSKQFAADVAAGRKSQR